MVDFQRHNFQTNANIGEINAHTTSSNPVYFPQQKMEHDKIKGENRTELCSCFFIHLTKYATLC